MHAVAFIAKIGGNLDSFDTVDRLAAGVGVAPVPRDSGRISGKLYPPRRFNRRLLRTRYLAALSSLKNNSSRAVHTRNGARGSLTNRTSLRSRGAGSTLFGPCSATTPSTNNPPLSPSLSLLDNSIEIPHVMKRLAGRLRVYLDSGPEFRGGVIFDFRLRVDV
ncbi:transposase [Rhodococcus globerulus]|uniref:transposase n=1 Tax=Rhodococcus globerulus TaxID=33008 RepID=UPI003AFA1A5A